MANEFGNKPHKGIRSFSGPEATNVILGQGGFDLIKGASGDGTEVIAGETAGYENVRQWVAIKAVEGVDVECEFESAIGDDFSQIGRYAPTGTTNNMTLKDQDIVNGTFTKIRIIGATCFVIAYRG